MSEQHGYKHFQERFKVVHNDDVNVSAMINKKLKELKAKGWEIVDFSWGPTAGRIYEITLEITAKRKNVITTKQKAT